MNRFGDIDCSFKRLPPVYGFRTEKIVSIEKSLRPLEPEIDQLPYFIKLAKKHCHFPNDHGLSKDQAAAIYIYTMEWGESTLYRMLNQALRSENRSALKIWFPYLRLFDSALDLLPTVKEVVWRGVPLDIGKNFTKNHIFTWWAVSSCSSSVDVIERFLNNEKNSTLFLIEVLNGKKVSGYTEFENEDEIILKIGTEFRVKANPLKRTDGSHTVHLIQIEDSGSDESDDDQDNNRTLTTAIKTLNVTSQPSNKHTSDQYTFCSHQLKSNIKWKQDAITVAGEKGYGKQLNQLSCPEGIYVDDDQQVIYIADLGNHRVVQWKFGANSGQVIAGENGRGNQIDQLESPTDVIVDQKTKSLIICDRQNKRVVQQSLENQQDRQILISGIYCYASMMNEKGDLFVSEYASDQVRRWKKGEKEGTVVVGGNGQGDKLNQLNMPSFIFIDRNETVYVSDQDNHRVMKWLKDAKEGIVVAGGHGKGNSLKQLDEPEGIVVNEVGDVYVADYGNNRIVCWPSRSKEGYVVVGGHGKGRGSNQFNNPKGLAFDRKNNLYVADCVNSRIQRFDVDES